MTLQDPTFRPTGVATSLAQPLSPLMSSDEAYMARQTEALWRHCILTKRSWGWSLPDESAPYLILSTVNTHGTFANGNGGTGLLRLPWYSQPGVTQIGVQVTVGIDDTALDFAVQAHTVSLITSVATASSNEVSITPNQSPLRGAWGLYGYSNQDRKLVFGTVTMYITPEYPASRRVALTLTGAFRTIADPTALSITRKAYAMNMMAWDVPPEPDGT